MQAVQNQLRSSFRRFPTQLLALVLVLVAAMLAGLLVAGMAVHWHRSAAQPASISVVGTGSGDADTESTGAPIVTNTGPSGTDAPGQVETERRYAGGQVRDAEILIGGGLSVTP